MDIYNDSAHRQDRTCSSFVHILGKANRPCLNDVVCEDDLRLLFFLQRNQIVAQVLDSLLNGGLVVIVHVLENAAPGGHVGGAVRGEARAKTQDVGDEVGGEFTAVAFGERGEIGGGNFERGSSGAMSLGVEAVAGGAVLLEHRFARWHEVGQGAL